MSTACPHIQSCVLSSTCNLNEKLFCCIIFCTNTKITCVLSLSIYMKCDSSLPYIITPPPCALLSPVPLEYFSFYFLMILPLTAFFPLGFHCHFTTTSTTTIIITNSASTAITASQMYLINFTTTVITITCHRHHHHCLSDYFTTAINATKPLTLLPSSNPTFFLKGHEIYHSSPSITPLSIQPLIHSYLCAGFIETDFGNINPLVLTKMYKFNSLISRQFPLRLSHYQ